MKGYVAVAATTAAAATAAKTCTVHMVATFTQIMKGNQIFDSRTKSEGHELYYKHMKKLPPD